MKRLTAQQFLRKLARTRNTAGWRLLARGDNKPPFIRSAGDWCPLQVVAGIRSSDYFNILRYDAAYNAAWAADGLSTGAAGYKWWRPRLLKACGLSE